jgi:hypothetical protein
MNRLWSVDGVCGNYDRSRSELVSFQKPHLSPTDRVAGFAANGKHNAVREDLWPKARSHRRAFLGQVAKLGPQPAHYTDLVPIRSRSGSRRVFSGWLRPAISLFFP